MKTLRIELKQGENVLNINREFTHEMVQMDCIASTVTGHILTIFNTAKEHGIKLDFKFSKSFELNIHTNNGSLNFNKSIFADLGLSGFKVVNTDKSKERLAKFIGAMVKDLLTKTEYAEIFDADDVVALAKKVLVAN